MALRQALEYNLSVFGSEIPTEQQVKDFELCMIFEENCPKILRLIKEGANPNVVFSSCEEDRHCALFNSISNGCSRNVMTLIAHGAKIGLLDIGGDSPMLNIHSWIKDGKTEQVKILFQLGVDLNIADVSGLGYAPLHSAIQYENVELSEMLIGSGADVNVLTTSYRFSGGVAPLRLSLDKGPVFDDISISLIKNGADVNVHEMHGQKLPITSFFCYRENFGNDRDLELFTLLVAKSSDEEAELAMEGVVSARWKEGLKVLLDRGVDIDLKIYQEESSLLVSLQREHCEGKKGRFDFPKFLIEKGANVDTIDFNVLAQENDINGIIFSIDNGAKMTKPYSFIDRLLPGLKELPEFWYKDYDNPEFWDMDMFYPEGVCFCDFLWKRHQERKFEKQISEFRGRMKKIFERHQRVYRKKSK